MEFRQKMGHPEESSENLGTTAEEDLDYGFLVIVAQQD